MPVIENCAMYPTILFKKLSTLLSTKYPLQIPQTQFKRLSEKRSILPRILNSFINLPLHSRIDSSKLDYTLLKLKSRFNYRTITFHLIHTNITFIHIALIKCYNISHKSALVSSTKYQPIHGFRRIFRFMDYIIDYFLLSFGLACARESIIMMP